MDRQPKSPRPEPSHCTHLTWRTAHDGTRRVGLCGMRLDEHGHCPFDDSPMHK